MSSRDHPPLQNSRAGSGIPGLAGLPTHPGGMAERPMDRTRQPRRWRLLGRCLAADHVGLLTRARACHDGTAHSRLRMTKTAAPLRGHASACRASRSVDVVPSTNRSARQGREFGPAAVAGELRLGKPCSTHLTDASHGRTRAGASLPQFRRDLARAWRLMLALQIDEALRMIERLELQLDDVTPANARRLRGATQLLRAAGLAFQDDSLAVLPIAVSLLKKGGTTQDDHAALTLCRLGFWRLGEFDSFCSLPRLEPRARWSKSLAISAMLDLSIEAAVALDHLRLSTARRLALDAMSIAKSTPKEAAGLATVPACVAAQVLYEEGCVDQADTLLRDRLPVINARGPIESALRAYLVLTRIAKQRKQCDFAIPVAPRGRGVGGTPGLAAARCSMPRRARLVAVAGRPDAGSSSRPGIPRSLCGVAPFGIRTRHLRDHSISHPYALARVLGRDALGGGCGGIAAALSSGD